MPYYFGLATGEYFCTECCEKENEGEGRLKKYAVAQNCILLMGRLIVNVNRSGKNVQPKSDK